MNLIAWLLTQQVLITAFVYGIAETQCPQCLLGDAGAVAGAAVEVDYRIFVGCDFADAGGYFFIGDVGRAVNMACIEFGNSADIDPNTSEIIGSHNTDLCSVVGRAA